MGGEAVAFARRLRGEDRSLREVAEGFVAAGRSPCVGRTWHVQVLARIVAQCYRPRLAARRPPATRPRGASGRRAADLLLAYVLAHNDGVRTGRFGALVGLFAPTGRIRLRGALEGVPPCVRRGGVRAAFRRGAPTDALVLRRVVARSAGRADAVHAWAAHPRRAAGRLELAARAGRIQELVVRARMR